MLQLKLKSSYLWVGNKKKTPQWNEKSISLACCKKSFAATPLIFSTTNKLVFGVSAKESSRMHCNWRWGKNFVKNETSQE